jgi:hypothetical protein
LRRIEMIIDDEKTYGELMTFLLQRRRHHGTDDRFKSYVAESVQVLAKDLRAFGLEITVEKCSARDVVFRQKLNSLSVGCE